MSKYSIPQDETILNALRAINEAAISAIVVCDRDLVCGILTDGDLRRAIIGGAELSDSIRPHFSKDFISVSPETQRSDVLDLMQARVVEQIPIVDANGNLMGVHTLHSILGREKRNNWCVIMAGGQGRRLGKLTQKRPKPMLRVAGKPILERLVLHLVGHGISHIFISVNYLSEVIKDYFGDGSQWGCRISYLQESEPLGSGGALSLLTEAPTEPLILVNGDLLIEANISEMLQFHEKSEYYATMGVYYYSHEVPYGCVELTGNRIEQLTEKPVVTKTINAGVYVLSPEAVGAVPKEQFFAVTGLFEDALKEDRPCGAYPLDGDWLDIGERDHLERAREGR